MNATRQFVLAVSVVVLGLVSIWAFANGIEPRPIAGADRPGLVKTVAGLCIATWGYLLVYLFRGMSARQLSSGWCPVLLAGACAILFLMLGCFGRWAGV
jgi:hypothetical protein